jgi:hypothetical protein
MGAQVTGDLDGEVPHTAAGGMDEDPLPGGDVRGVEQ